eukprot:NODE_2165_length_1273_cov_38.975490_g1969_i0.p1 GENE.NODE_2165_length_1273_cov_38.975490_g1969_i0~~NODE_2165_length_1273_cov_38.975490_g1969_i0.p1  ORF type:complete len:306 (+),score=45.24 NODE_2165_length_1273_cov_38.975490_g1969_i0:66-983(+)
MLSDEVPLKASPSLLYQNLTYGEGKFVYAHKTEIHSVNASTKETSSFQLKEKTPAYNARVCDVGGKKMLVIACHGGTQFWDVGREKLLFSVPLSEEDARDSFLSRGIASFGNFVLVGHSTGSISVIEVKGESASLSKVLKEHKEMITDVCAGQIAGRTVVVSADVAGEVLLWDESLNVTARCEKFPGDTATCLALTSCHFACGYGSGKIRLFDLAGKKKVEIAAHCRWINGLDFSSSSNTLASVSEDMLVQFWKVPTADSSQVALKAHKLIKDCLLCGVKFTDDGTRVGCTAYDTERLFLLQVPC